MPVRLWGVMLAAGVVAAVPVAGSRVVASTPMLPLQPAPPLPAPPPPSQVKQTAAKASSAKSPGPLPELASALRNLLRRSLPPTLYESSSNWGNQREAFGRPRNDGTWRKVRVTTRDLDRTLVFQMSDLKRPTKDKMTFRAFLSFQAGVEFEQQIWESGVRLYSGSTRARLKVNLPMRCETTMRVEEGKSRFLPEVVGRFRVLQADLSYDDLVVEHIAGIGGTGAKLLGDALHSMVKQIRPSLERDLLAKANAAIVRAGDTREIRLGLSALMGGDTK